MKPSRKRVLIADCHEDILIILERLLEDAGFDTTTVWTAKEALKLADSHAFDLILINEYLPDAECEDVLKALQRKGELIPCIVMQPSAPEIVDFTRFEALGAKGSLGFSAFLSCAGRCSPRASMRIDGL
jgi:CheY-like chemotaxis protein